MKPLTRAAPHERKEKNKKKRSLPRKTRRIRVFREFCSAVFLRMMLYICRKHNIAGKAFRPLSGNQGVSGFSFRSVRTVRELADFTDEQILARGSRNNLLNSPTPLKSTYPLLTL